MVCIWFSSKRGKQCKSKSVLLFIRSTKHAALHFFLPPGYDQKENNTLPINPRNTTAFPPTDNPEATSGNRNGSPLSSPAPPPPSPGNHATRVSSLTGTLVMVLLSLFCHYVINISSWGLGVPLYHFSSQFCFRCILPFFLFVSINLKPQCCK